MEENICLCFPSVTTMMQDLGSLRTSGEEEESERFCYCYHEIWKLPGIGRNYEWFYDLIKV